MTGSVVTLCLQAGRGVVVALILSSILGTPARADQPGPKDPGILRVITYNAQFLPEPVSWKNERSKPEYRARRIAEELQDLDLVGLQETFHEHHRRLIIERTRNLWTGKLQSVISPKPADFHTNGGCLIMTRRPLLASSSLVFENYSKPADYGLRADGFAAKGVIHARIARSPQEPMYS